MTFSRKASPEWMGLSPIERISRVQKEIGPPKGGLIAIRIEGHGKVILQVNTPVQLSSSERGALLLYQEQLLRRKIGPWIEVFLEPVVDKNKLRQLRGVDA